MSCRISSKHERIGRGEYGVREAGKLVLMAITAVDDERRHDGSFARSLRILQLGGCLRKLSL